MGMFTYKDVPAALVPFSKPAFDLIRNEDRCAIFDFKNDLVVILDHTTPANGFIGTVQEAIGAGIVSFTRATAASRRNAAGLIESVASGVWRRQYDPVTLQPLGYLSESQRTNLLTNSLLGAAGWVTANVSRAASGEVAPDGSGAATLVTATGTSFPRVSANTSLTAGTTYTRSVFFKAGSTTFVHGTIELSGQTARFYANLATGAVTAAVQAGTMVIAGTQLTAAGNGWWRFAIAFTPAVTGSYSFFFGPASAYVSSSANVGDSIHIWGAQEEVGTYPSSYIPTAGSAVTRNADVMYADLTKLPFSAAEYTVTGAAQPNPDAVSFTNNLFSVHGDANNYAMLMNRNAGDRGLHMVGQSGGSPTLIAGATSVYPAERVRFASAFKANDAQLVRNGATAGAVDNSGAMPIGPTRLYIGTQASGAPGGPWSAPLEHLTLTPRRLPQAEMIARTAA